MACSTEIQGQIEVVEGELLPLTAHLDGLMEQFGKEIVPAVQSWMKDEFMRRLEDNAEIVNAGGIRLVRSMKADLDALLERSPQYCAAAVGEPKTWPHRDQFQKRDDYRYASADSFFASAFRTAINNLGQVLSRHGLIRAQSGMANWQRAGGDTYRYTVNAGFDAREYALIDQYSELVNKQKLLQKQLGELRANLAKAQAKELWDRA